MANDNHVPHRTTGRRGRERKKEREGGADLAILSTLSKKKTSAPFIPQETIRSILCAIVTEGKHSVHGQLILIVTNNCQCRRNAIAVETVLRTAIKETCAVTIHSSVHKDHRGVKSRAEPSLSFVLSYFQSFFFFFVFCLPPSSSFSILLFLLHLHLSAFSHSLRTTLPFFISSPLLLFSFLLLLSLLPSLSQHTPTLYFTDKNSNSKKQRMTTARAGTSNLNRRRDNHPRRLSPVDNDNSNDLVLFETDQTSFSKVDKYHPQQPQRPPSPLSSPSDYINSIPSSSSSQEEPTTGSPFVLLHRPSQPVSSFGSVPSISKPDDYSKSMHLPTDSNGGDNNDNDDDDATWLIAVVLTTALLVTLASVIRSCGQKAGWLPLSMHSSQDGHEPLLGGSGGGHGPGGGPSRYHSSGPHQVPSEDEPDPDSTLNENDERWALLTEAQRQAYTSSRGIFPFFLLFNLAWLCSELRC